jgi:hypothetical protein
VKTSREAQIYWESKKHADEEMKKMKQENSQITSCWRRASQSETEYTTASR